MSEVKLAKRSETIKMISDENRGGDLYIHMKLRSKNNRTQMNQSHEFTIGNRIRE